MLTNPTDTNAAEQPGSPTRICHEPENLPRIDVGPRWGVARNPHNSSGTPGPDFIQAKTEMYCNDRLSQLGTLTVTNSIYVYDTGTRRWTFLQRNTSECNAATVNDPTYGWVQCRTVNEGAHPVMIAGVNTTCVKGTRYDYLQSSSAVLITNEGRRYAGAAAKAAYNVRCKGK